MNGQIVAASICWNLGVNKLARWLRYKLQLNSRSSWRKSRKSKRVIWSFGHLTHKHGLNDLSNFVFLFGINTQRCLHSFYQVFPKLTVTIQLLIYYFYPRSHTCNMGNVIYINWRNNGNSGTQNTVFFFRKLLIPCVQQQGLQKIWR